MKRLTDTREKQLVYCMQGGILQCRKIAYRGQNKVQSKQLREATLTTEQH